ncbi:uncharacterized protein LOC144349499 [Saccoglossus kowalevskii]
MADVRIDSYRSWRPFFGILLGLVASGLYMYSTGSKYWYTIKETDTNTGLWYTCQTVDGTQICIEYRLSDVEVYVHVARSMMIISCLLSFYVIFMLVVAYLVQQFNKKLKFAGIVVWISVIPVVIATSVYTTMAKSDIEESGQVYHIGNSVLVAWQAIVVSLIAGAILILEHRRINKHDYISIK